MNIEAKPQGISLTKQYQLEGPPEEPAFMIPISEWEYLKSRVLENKPTPLVYHTVGSVSAGICGSGFIAGFTIPPTLQIWGVQANFAVISVSVIFLTAAVFSFILFRKQKSTFLEATDRIGEEFDRVRARYSTCTKQ